MTLNAFLDAREESARTDEERRGSLQHTGRSRREGVAVQAVHLLARVVAPLLAGIVAAAAVDAGMVVTAVVLGSWAAVQLQAQVGGLHAPTDLTNATRHMAVPFVLVALGVAAGTLPEHALAKALLIAVSATALLFLASLVLQHRRRPSRVVVVGDGPGVGQSVARFAQSDGVDIVHAAVLGGRLDGADVQFVRETFGLSASQGLDDIAERVEWLGADTVVVLPSAAVGSADIRRLCWALEGTGTRLAVHTDLTSVARHRITVSSLGDCMLTEIRPSRAPIHVRSLKFLFDRVVAAVLLVLLAPLLALLVLAIRLDSRGPGFFTQVRVGQGGRLFKVWKLRTMCTEAEVLKSDLGEQDEGNGVLFKVHRDPRITRLGRVLRKTSLDELPQLINVVKGEMSLVGPRPALPREVEQYDEIARRRLAVRPGITGLWQVSGRSDLDWDKTVALDVHYTDNITIVDDLRICLRTVRAVTSGKGAY
ncbi:exopolysaccharide biosynthesis polyprenyl glycosylphosphotransferase [Nocardioides sp. MAHUQ-72]|uniref:exopolysaccharide biosynthesis polyprenyl glycosylphosphotransferase n=1 Tax=unclassified Nocardioides TaxID=2615069 RepID=UPI00360842F6